MLCGAIKFKGWRNSKIWAQRNLCFIVPVYYKKKNNSLPVPRRAAEGFCHLLSSAAPLKSFVCAKEKEKKKKERKKNSRHALFNAHWWLTDNNFRYKRRRVDLSLGVCFFSLSL